MRRTDPMAHPLVAWVPVGVAVAVYASSVRNGFVYDDVRVILDRPDVQSLSNWWQIVTSGWWPHALYRPLSKMTLAVDWAVSGGAAWYFHLVNVVLHATVTGGVWWVARRWIGPIGATAAGIVFAVHPVHVEAVANVVGRTEMLATAFALLGVWLYSRDADLAAQNPRDRRRLVTAFGTLACVGLGLASKESAFAIPGLLLLVDWIDSTQRDQTFESRFRVHGVLWLATVALAVEWLVMRSVVLGDLAGDDPAPGLFGEGFVGRALIMAPVVLQYVRLLVFPARLSADYSPDFLSAVPTVGPTALAGIAVVVALVWVAVFLRRRTPVTSFAIAWMGGTILIVSNLIVPTGVLLSERSMYLPSVGVALIAGELIRRVWDGHRRVVVLGTAAVVVAGAVRTVTRVPVWRDNERFFPQLVADAPGSFRGAWVAGQLRFIEGRPAEGEALLRRAIQIYPFFANTWQSLGQQLQVQQRWGEAADAFGVAFRLNPNRVYDAAAAVSNYVRAGLIDSALAVADRASTIDPFDHRLLAARADLAYAAGRPLEAMTWRRRAAVFSDNSPFYWYLDGLAAIRAGYCPELQRSVGRIAAVDADHPRLPELRDSLSIMDCANDRS